MRTLKFIVDGLTVKPDPKCDFSGLIPGTQNYLLAEFSFSKEWKNTAKVVGFYSRLGNEYSPQLLKDGRTCTIPVEALRKRVFKLKVIGQNGLATNKLSVKQEGGNV